jgi:hypothetical protein
VAAGEAFTASSPAGEDLSALTCQELRTLCKEQKLHTSGNKGALLERLRSPEQLRDASTVAAKQVSPVKSDGRAEPCVYCGDAAAFDHQCDAGELQLAGELEEPFQLDVECKLLGKHDKHHFCCKIRGDQFPVPPPARVHHPALGIGHLSDRTMDLREADFSTSYGFLVRGRMDYFECFTR